MSFFVGILTVFLVLNCLLLILLVLIQLPKKDAGAGMAFGGGTADALFGAGSGSALTKITKYATGIFFALALFLSYLESSLHKSSSAAEFEKQVQQKQMQTPITQPPATSKPAAMPTNNLLAVPLTSPTDVPTNNPTAPTQSK
jgi:protein translocase SecG subunit